MSEYHFAREFKRSLGLTPKQYLTQCRIEEARRLLQTTGLKIQEVAQRVGFTSASHFAEVFRKQTGLRPREYRLRYGE
jgi:AraC family transcriptional regulator